MRLLGVLSVGFLAVAAAYFLLWPTDLNPVAWAAPTAPGFSGLFAVNTKLSSIKRIPLGAESQPEHVVLATDGRLYASVTNGAILRMHPDGSAQELFANTGGRVLGFAFDANSNLIAADSHRGLLSISPSRTITLLTDKVDGDSIRFADAVVIARNGIIYFTDASRRFAATIGALGSAHDPSQLDILENSATGRVLAYDPATRVTRTIASGLSFANGIALTESESHLLVAETGRYRIWKIAVEASSIEVSSGSPLATVLLDNLPGFPDNLLRGLDGRIWVGLPEARSPELDRMAQRPWLRKVVARLPNWLKPLPRPYGHVFAITENGTVVVDLQDPSGKFPRLTGVTETRDRLYLQNLNGAGLGVVSPNGTVP